MLFYRFKLMKINIFVLLLVIFSVFILIDFFPDKTEPDKASINGIYELMKINLGGYKQSILIRGFNKNNPIIVFLHGGPGFASISYIKKFQKEIERHFVAVNWDQRGSGKSYSFFLNDKTMNEEQLLIDLNELIDYLRYRFNKSKVYIVGHSWGTILGKDYVQAYPEKVEYFISIGQYVSEKESNIYSYNFLITESKKKSNQMIIDKLVKIGKPPYKGNINSQMVFRKCINDSGGNEISIKITHEMIKAAIFDQEYSVLDLLRLYIGNLYSLFHLYNEFSNRDFRNEKLIFEVPVIFILGRNDLVTNFQLAEEYFNKIECSDKQLIWFENSGHDPQYEEVEKFNHIITSLLK